MDVEAVSNDQLMAETVAHRRRSNSVSDDYSVQKTNDDATQCKQHAVQKGYWKDDFIQRFVSTSNPNSKPQRFPEISIGYWARVTVVEKYVRQFLSANNGKGQIISIGCGFDTLFWRLKEAGVAFDRFVEVDFSSVTAKKIRHIMKPGQPNLSAYFSDKPVISQHADLHTGNYHLIGADLRQINELNAKFDTAELDPNCPTIVISECVLVYLTAEDSSKLLSSLSQRFSNLSFVNYEQFHSSDAFSKVMEENLEVRGIHLHGLTVAGSEENQIKRFKEAGFKNVQVNDMNQVFSQILDQNEVKRIRSIEMLDEMELLHQLFEHYCVVFARN